uniref:Uncharacterized protein n=1 Tax=viral metagenome TaxID=1070528 RepID=A0A6M3JGH9_9ZZZZ
MGYMTEIIVKKGAYGEDLALTVTDDDDVAIDLSGYTLTLKVWEDYDPDTVLWTLTGTATDEASGEASFAITATDLDEAGVYYGEVNMVETGVSLRKSKTFKIIVKESV